jgi:sugar lactone lactonase YvrE
MYHSDSTAGIIEVWDFDVHSGALANRRVLATLSDEEGRPDGAAVDVEGNYWSAGPSAACINRFSPSGALLGKLPFPVPAPTMPCFAERQLYATSLREGRPAEALHQYPTMGGLFRTDAPVAGAPVGVFADG